MTIWRTCNGLSNNLDWSARDALGAAAVHPLDGTLSDYSRGRTQ